MELECRRRRGRSGKVARGVLRSVPTSSRVELDAYPRRIGDIGGTRDSKREFGVRPGYENMSTFDGLLADWQLLVHSYTFISGICIPLYSIKQRRLPATKNRRYPPHVQCASALRGGPLETCGLSLTISPSLYYSL